MLSWWYFLSYFPSVYWYWKIHTYILCFHYFDWFNKYFILHFDCSKLQSTLKRWFQSIKAHTPASELVFMLSLISMSLLYHFRKCAVYGFFILYFWVVHFTSIVVLLMLCHHCLIDSINNNIGPIKSLFTKLRNCLLFVLIIQTLYKDTLLLDYLYFRLCISSFGVFPVFCPIPTFYVKIPALYSKILSYLILYRFYPTRCVTGGSSLGWQGGPLGLVRVFKWACSLTCQPDSWFWIPVWLLLPQGAGEPSSALGPCNGNCYSTVYPPLYFQKGFLPFLCHESSQLQEYDQGFPT